MKIEDNGDRTLRIEVKKNRCILFTQHFSNGYGLVNATLLMEIDVIPNSTATTKEERMKFRKKAIKEALKRCYENPKY